MRRKDRSRNRPNRPRVVYYRVHFSIGRIDVAERPHASWAAECGRVCIQPLPHHLAQEGGRARQPLEGPYSAGRMACGFGWMGQINIPDEMQECDSPTQAIIRHLAWKNLHGTRERVKANSAPRAYMYTYTYIFMHLYIYIHTYIYIHFYPCICIQHFYVYISMYIYIYIYISINY